MTKPKISADTGLTAKEDRVLSLAAQLYGAWLDLPIEHPDDLREVTDAVHVVQRLLCCRIARRTFPAAWRTYPQ